MEPRNSKPVIIDIRGKDIVFDGLRDPKSFLTDYTKEKSYHFYTKEYFDKNIKEN
jgi:hypothetical protein